MHYTNDGAGIRNIHQRKLFSYKVKVKNGYHVTFKFRNIYMSIDQPTELKENQHSYRGIKQIYKHEPPEIHCNETHFLTFHSCKRPQEMCEEKWSSFYKMIFIIQN